MAKIAIAGFVHETNTFSPLPTTYDDFASNHGSRSGIKRQADFEKLLQANANVPMVGFAHKAAAYGHEIVFTLWTTTSPSGTIQCQAGGWYSDTCCSCPGSSWQYSPEQC